jgi:hypothetical protein
MHYDGATWSAMTSGTTAWLQGVWESAAADVFAVGTVGSNAGTVILHYDGAAWKTMTSGWTSGLDSVWGSSSSDVFAVGGDAVLHYGGQE